jgi:aminoglycoside phosphotransferase (APT) family kinase protein
VRALETYLRGEGILAGPIATSRRIGEGHSNVTELVGDGRSTVVVRRPPPPPWPPGAHDVVREARIQSALHDSMVPVPQILAIEDSGDVLGQPFYVMAHVAGIVVTDSAPSSLEGSGIAAALIDTLAALHRVDYVAVGLGGLGRPGRDVASHLRRFAQMIDADGHGLDGDLGSVQAWLCKDPPVPARLAIVHGDYRLGNVMFAATPPARILAVLDWELASIGDPLRDLGYLLATYAVPNEPLNALTGMSRAALAGGWPNRRELADRYARATGVDVSAVSWYEAMALWKLAVMFEYQRRRVADGIGDEFYAKPGLVEEFLAAAGAITEGMRT